MPTPPLDPKEAQRRITVIEQCLREGYTPPGMSGGKGSCIAEAEKRLGLRSLKGWIDSQAERARRGRHSVTPDWSIYTTKVAAPAAIERRMNARRWLLTAAQNDTAIHPQFFENMKAYSAFLGAEILVAPFTYQKAVFSDHTTRNNVFAEAVRPYLRFERTMCGPLHFCAEMNTLPTAERPLSGLHSYTRGQWAVFPHAKVALETVPATLGQKPTIIMTTGCCTVENYIPKKAGLKAHFHHVIGCTIVELTNEGKIFCRNINSLEDGSFQDLDCVVTSGRVETGRRIKAITWGDIHAVQLDPKVAMSGWGFDTSTWKPAAPLGMLDVLRPEYQFFHDIFDGESINHWIAQSPHERYSLFVDGKLNVQREIDRTAAFLRAATRDWCRSVVVESNHDIWISRWLQRPGWQEDLENAEAFHRWNHAAYVGRRLETEEESFSIFRHVLRESDPKQLEGVDFVPIGDSFIICPERGGIECGLHGHIGVNGSRGSTRGLSRLAIKINKGHDHTACIMDGVYSTGVCGINPRLMNGPSTATNSHIAVYANGKRCIITMQDGEWRA